jgi:hypothetical protein
MATICGFGSCGTTVPKKTSGEGGQSGSPKLDIFNQVFSDLKAGKIAGRAVLMI